MSVWPLVNKLRILQGSVYNLFDFTELDCAPSFLLGFFVVVVVGFFSSFIEGLLLLSRRV